MRLAVLTDIHANRAAFEAVLADVAAVGADRIALLGDVVGYGPDPGWCADRAAQLAGQGAVCLLGNHDAALAVPDPAMNAAAQTAIRWTVGQLDAGQTALLTGLPRSARLGDLLLTHASPEAPSDWIYVTSSARARGGLSVTDARVVICGHVHVPALYSRDMTGLISRHEPVIGRTAPLLRTRRWLAVAGSVGQPRDGSPQAAWALFDTARSELTFRRVPYDAALTAARIRAAGLPDSLARRLLTGD